MKKHLKLISLLSLFIIATTTFFIFAKRPADDKPNTVVVRTFQQRMTGGKKFAWVDYGNSRIEKTQLDGAFDFDDASSSGSKVLAIIQKLNLEGYTVVSQSENRGGHDGDIYTETWVLTLK